MWYQQVLKKAEMIEYCTDISGCYVLRPWSYSIWEKLQAELDAHFKRVSLFVNSILVELTKIELPKTYIYVLLAWC